MEKSYAVIEVPYNFDKKLISYLYSYNPSGELYHCIYCPPFWKDYVSAKYYHHDKIGKNLNKNREMSRDHYVSHIDNIRNFFPSKLMLLLQQNEDLIDTDLLKEFYIKKLGFRKFCVGSIAQAKIIKEIDPNLEVVASITMRCEPEDLNKEEMRKYFDCIVLWFPYNRDIEKTESLPKCFKYILLSNCGCSVHCQGIHHWLAKNEEEDKKATCPPKEKFEDIILIHPEHLYLWKNCISYFKLQGREYHTSSLIQDIVFYTSADLNVEKPKEVYEFERSLYTKKKGENI